MTKVIKINERGTLTLPKDFRQRSGIGARGEVVVEETSNGLLLRPVAPTQVEVYSKKRIAEFTRSNDGALAGFKLKR